MILNGFDDVDVKDVPSFLHGAPPSDTVARAWNHLQVWCDIENTASRPYCLTCPSLTGILRNWMRYRDPITAMLVQ